MTFKADTDDVRKAPSIAIADWLQRHGAAIRAYDPQGMANAAHLLNEVGFAQTAYEAAAGADCVVLATEWLEFADLDPARLIDLVGEPLLIDLRNLIDANQFAAAGFKVWNVGCSGLSSASFDDALKAEVA